MIRSAEPFWKDNPLAENSPRPALRARLQTADAPFATQTIPPSSKTGQRKALSFPSPRSAQRPARPQAGSSWPRSIAKSLHARAFPSRCRSGWRSSQFYPPCPQDNSGTRTGARREALAATPLPSAPQFPSCRKFATFSANFAPHVTLRRARVAVKPSRCHLKLPRRFFLPLRLTESSSRPMFWPDAKPIRSATPSRQPFVECPAPGSQTIRHRSTP